MTAVLVTGGLGYIGGRVAQHLAAAGHAVRILTRRAPAQRPEWAASLEVRQADPLADGDLAAACVGIEAIVHLAAMNEVDCTSDPAGCVSGTVEATARLIEAGRKAGTKQFIYFSTARIYGEPLQGTVDENMVPRPFHPYGITHRAAEDFVLAENRRGAMAGMVLRLSNAVGAPADPLINRWMLVVNDLCRQAASQRKLVLKSSGLQTRDFIPLGEVCRAVSHFLALPAAGWGDGIFNLGVNRPVTVLSVTELIAERCEAVLGFRPPVERPQPAPGESHPDLDFKVEKLKRTGFIPDPDLTAEIDATLRLAGSAFGR